MLFNVEHTKTQNHCGLTKLKLLNLKEITLIVCKGDNILF